MTRDHEHDHDSALDQTVKLSGRDWLSIAAVVVLVLAAFFELRSQVTAQISTAREINARQDGAIKNLQTDVRELRVGR